MQISVSHLLQKVPVCPTIQVIMDKMESKQETRSDLKQTRQVENDKPALAADPEKMKEFIGNFERNKINTGRTQEGVEQDLDRAYAVTYADLLLSREREQSVRKAEGISLFSEPAVSRGSTSYFSEKPTYNDIISNLSQDDRTVIARMNITVEEWAKEKEKYS